MSLPSSDLTYNFRKDSGGNWNRSSVDLTPGTPSGRWATGTTTYQWQTWNWTTPAWNAIGGATSAAYNVTPAMIEALPDVASYGLYRCVFTNDGNSESSVVFAVGIGGLGEKGDPGDDGADGTNGTDGTDGSDGAPGADGQDGESVNIVFRRAETQPATPDPSSGTPTDWYDSVNDVPAGGDPIWSSVGKRPGSTGDWTWKTPVKIEGSDGLDGENGLSVAELIIFRRAATQPSTPTGGEFNFGTQTLTAPTNWSASIPAGSDPVWTSIALASIIGQDGTDDSLTWSTPVKAYQDGVDGSDGAPGSDGSDGSDGTGTVIVFIRSKTGPPTPDTTDVPPTGWSLSVPSGSDPLWSSTAPTNAARTVATGPYTDVERIGGTWVIRSATEPTTSTHALLQGDLWFDLVDPPDDIRLYSWDGSQWVPGIALIAAERVVAATLSAISADIGLVTAGVLQSSNWSTSAGSQIDLDDGTLAFGGWDSPLLEFNGTNLVFNTGPGDVPITLGPGGMTLGDFFRLEQREGGSWTGQELMLFAGNDGLGEGISLGWVSFPGFSVLSVVGTAALDFGDNRLREVALPTSGTDAVNRNYVVDNFVPLSGVKTIAGATTFEAAALFEGGLDFLGVLSGPTLDVGAATVTSLHIDNNAWGVWHTYEGDETPDPPAGSVGNRGDFAYEWNHRRVYRKSGTTTWTHVSTWPAP